MKKRLVLGVLGNALGDTTRCCVKVCQRGFRYYVFSPQLARCNRIFEFSAGSRAMEKVEVIDAVDDRLVHPHQYTKRIRNGV